MNVPVSYSVATTRAPQDITDPKTYRQLSLGADRIYLQPEEKATDPVTLDEFTDALRARKKATGLYSERVGGVQFLSQNLFRATLALAPNVPVGTHKARAFLFKSGLFVKETSAPAGDREVGLRAIDLQLRARVQPVLRHLRRAARHAHRLARKHRLPQGLRRRLDLDDAGPIEMPQAKLARTGRTLVLAGFVPFAVLAFWLYGIAPDHPWRHGTIVLLTAYGAVDPVVPRRHPLGHCAGSRADGDSQRDHHPQRRAAADRLDRRSWCRRR